MEQPDEQQREEFNIMVKTTVDKIVDNPEAFKNLVKAQGQQLLTQDPVVFNKFKEGDDYKIYIESFDVAEEQMMDGAGSLNFDPNARPTTADIADIAAAVTSNAFTNSLAKLAPPDSDDPADIAQQGPPPPSRPPSSDGTPRDEAHAIVRGALNASALPALAAATSAPTAAALTSPIPAKLAQGDGGGGVAPGGVQGRNDGGGGVGRGAQTSTAVRPLAAATSAPTAAALTSPIPAKLAQGDGGGGVAPGGVQGRNDGGGGVGRGAQTSTAVRPLAPNLAQPNPIVSAPDTEQLFPEITKLINDVVTKQRYKQEALNDILSYLQNARSGGQRVIDHLVAVAKTALNDILNSHQQQDSIYDLTKEHQHPRYNTTSEQASIEADIILRNLRRQIHLNSSIISSHINSSIAYLQTEINNVGILKILEEYIKVKKTKSVLPSVFTDFYNRYKEKLNNWTKRLQHENNPSTTLVILIEQMIKDLAEQKKTISTRYIKASEKYNKLTAQNTWLLEDDKYVGIVTPFGRQDREEFMETNKDTIDDYTICTKQLANIIRLEEHVLTIYAYAMAAVMIRENPDYPSTDGKVASIKKIKETNDRLTAILNEEYDYMNDVDIAKREIARNSQGGGGGARTKLIGKRTKKINYYNNKRIKTGLRRTKGRNNGQRRTKGRNNGQRRTKGRIS